MSIDAKNFDILATSLRFYIIILIVKQNNFSKSFPHLYPAKILDLSTKLCIYSRKKQFC